MKILIITIGYWRWSKNDIILLKLQKNFIYNQKLWCSFTIYIDKRTGHSLVGGHALVDLPYVTLLVDNWIDSGMDQVSESITRQSVPVWCLKCVYNLR